MFTSKTFIRNIIITTLIFSVVVLVIPDAHAIAGAPAGGTLGDDLVKLVGYIAMINTFMHVMLLIALQFLGYLLQADFFNDPVMMGALNNIWQLSRDIMNVIFALMLIGVSFLVIITGKTDKAKEKVVNFVVAVILVNFSWFFPRVILDIANVMTATVYTIPNALGAATCFTISQNNNPVECRVITDAIIFPTAIESTPGAVGYCGGPFNTSCTCLEGIECHKSDTYSNALVTMKPAHAMLNGLAVSFARISILARIPTTVAGPAPGGGLTPNQAASVSFQIAISIMLAFAVQAAVLLPLLGLAVGLFIRIIILWVTTAFMPFAFLGYVINGKLGTNVFEFETDIWKEFINAAFLPTIVAIPFVIGFIMLTAVAQIPAPPGMFGLTISVPILSGVNTWWQLLWMGAAVGIIWTGAFKALSRSKIIGGITDKIKGFGESIFSGIAQAPLLIPIPLPNGKMGNVGTLVHGPKILADSVRLAASGVGGNSFSKIIADRFGSKPDAGGWGGDTQVLSDRITAAGAQNANNIVNAIKELNLNAPGLDRQAKFDEIRRNMPVEAQGLSNSGTIKALQELINVQNPNSVLKGIETEIRNLKE